MVKIINKKINKLFIHSFLNKGIIPVYIKIKCKKDVYTMEEEELQYSFTDKFFRYELYYEIDDIKDNVVFYRIVDIEMFNNFNGGIKC